MKRTYIIAGILLTTCIAFFACKKNELSVTSYDLADGKALLKFIYSCPYSNNPSVLIKINGEVVSNLLTYSTPFPGGGYNTGGSTTPDYLAVTPGNNTVNICIPKSGTNTDSIVLYTTTIALQANTYNSLHITDTSANTQSVLLQDTCVRPDSGYTKFKFVNLIPNAAAVDLYFGTTKVASDVAYKSETAPFLLPAGTSAAWSVRLAGGTSTLGSTYSSASTVSNQRVFTVYARGYAGITATSDVRIPKVSFALNR